MHVSAALATTLLLVMSVGATSVARAQCAEGRVVSEATAGRCCWPGQTWNDAAARCDGPPACPSGRVGHGDACITASPLPAPAPAPAPAVAPSQPAWAPAGPTRDLSDRGPEPESEPIVGLAIAGGVSFGITYLATIITASINIATCYGSCGWYALGYVPVLGASLFAGIGGAGAVGTYERTWPLAFYLPSGAVQMLTFTLMVAGLAMRRPKRAAYAVEEAVPELVGGPGDAGLGLRWTF